MTREDELFKRIEKGDKGAIEELAALYYPEILRYCVWNAPNKFLAEDAAQETFLKAFRYFERYIHQGKFKSFLYQIASNTCIDMKRRKWATEVGYEQLSSEPEYQDRGFNEIDDRIQIRQLVKGLPIELQEIVILRYAQELTMREIAEIVNQPLRTVQSRLRRALKRLKKEMVYEAQRDSVRRYQAQSYKEQNYREKKERDGNGRAEKQQLDEEHSNQ